MPRSLRAFSLDIALQSRFDALTEQSSEASAVVALLFKLSGVGPGSTEFRTAHEPLTLDSYGLRPEDYEPLFELLKAPSATPRTPDGYLTAVQHYRAKHLTSKDKFPLLDELNAHVQVSRAKNRKDNKARFVRQAQYRRHNGVAISASRLVDALITLGLNTLDNAKAREQNDRSSKSKGSKVGKGGHATKAEGKRAYGHARPNVAVSTIN